MLKSKGYDNAYIRQVFEIWGGICFINLKVALDQLLNP